MTLLLPGSSGRSAVLAGRTVRTSSTLSSGSTRAPYFVISGVLRALEAADGYAQTGTVAEAPIPGTLATTEAKDVFAGIGQANPPVSGVVIAFEARDAFAGVINVATIGTLAATDAQDVSGLTGVLGYSGSLAATETADASGIVGLFSTTSGSGSPVGLLLGITQTSAAPSGTAGQSAGLLLGITRAS